MIATILIPLKVYGVVQDWTGFPPIVLIVGEALDLLLAGKGSHFFVAGAAAASSVAPVIV